jgi:hypothetical protein
MKKLFVFVVFLFLAACGNSGDSSSLESFDNSNLKEELNREAFQPMLPTKTPFEVIDAQVSHPPNQDNVLMIDFMSSGKSNHMGLMVVVGKNIESSLMGFEEVKIGDLKGKYAVKDTEAKILKWTEDGISYDLTYFEKQSKEDITKKELIKMAESFE